MKTLIIVDLQAGFEVPPRLVSRIARYSRQFDRRVYTRFVNPPNSPFRRHLKQKSCAPGSADTELLLQPEKGDIVVDKTGYGLSARTISRLKRLGIKRATVCGIETDACVLGVLFTLFDAGIDCRAKGDLCWSSTGLHRAALKVIKEQFPGEP